MADTLKTLTCPACGKQMEKVFIPSEGINLDICTEGCGGIYFDNREFKDFDEKNEDISAILDKISGKEFQKVDDTAVRTCPNCGSKMVKNGSSIKQSIIVDDCYNCGGKFLDNNELQKIRSEYENNEERDQDIRAYVYKEVGSDINALDRAHARAVSSRTVGQKLFYKLLGL